MDHNKKFIIAKCPHCNHSIMYSTNPQDKTTVKVFPVGEHYKGKSQICSKCKKHYVAIEEPPHLVVLPILQAAPN